MGEKCLTCYKVGKKLGDWNRFIPWVIDIFRNVKLMTAMRRKLSGFQNVENNFASITEEHRETNEQ